MDKLEQIIIHLLTVKEISEFNIIASFSKSELVLSDSQKLRGDNKVINYNKTKERQESHYIASIVAYLGNIDNQLLYDRMTSFNKSHIKELYIVHVHLTGEDQPVLKFRTSNTGVNKSTDVTGLKLTCYNISLNSFINNFDKFLRNLMPDVEKKEKNLLGISPIIIFHGIIWSNLLYLFRMNNIIVNGGSITRRHKLSIPAFRLTTFLVLSNLFEDKYLFYHNYIDKLITNSRYDEGYYNYLRMKIESGYVHENPIIIKFLTFNIFYRLVYSIKEGHSRLIKLSDFIKSEEASLYYKEQNIVELVQKLDHKLKKSLSLQGRKEKHKSAITGQIKNLRDEREGLLIEIKQLKNKISTSQIEMDDLKVKYEKLKSRLFEHVKYNMTDEFKENFNMDYLFDDKVSVSKTHNVNSESSLSLGQSDETYKSNCSEALVSPIITANIPDGNDSQLKEGSESDHSLGETEEVTNEAKVTTSSCSNFNSITSKNYDKHSTKGVFKLNGTLGDRSYSTILSKNKVYGLNQLFFTGVETKNIVIPILACKICRRLFSQNLGSKPINDTINNTINSNLKVKGPVFSYLDMISYIIKDSHGDLVLAQTRIENEWIRFMTERLNEPMTKVRNNMKQIIKNASESLLLRSQNNNLKRRFPKLHDKLNDDHLIMTLSYILTYISIHGFTSIAMIVSRNILFNLFQSELKKIKGHNYTPSDFIEFKEKVGILSDIDNLKLGSFFLDIFCTPPTNLFFRSFQPSDEDENENDFDPNYSVLAVLELNPQYVETIINNIIIHPTSLPMICPPNKWDDHNYGGFLENKINHKDLITGSNHHTHNIENKGKLYNAINYLNNIEFIINNQLLNYLENEGKILLDMYVKELKSESEKLQVSISLKIAKIFSNIPFYISTNADWRGRIYTQSFFISYQGGDLATSLLNFRNGEPLTSSGKDYLYIYGANCYNFNGLNKRSYQDRIKWVEDNYDQIIRMDLDFILKAESKFLFASFCLIMKEVDKNPNTPVYLPVFLDATCSGIQHLAALLQDFETGSRVNLIPQTDSDKVGDIYSDLIEPINQAIQKYGKDNEIYKLFRDIKLARKHIKSPIMTKVYNVSVKGIAQQLKSKFIPKKVNKETYYLAPGKEGPINLTYLEIFKIAQIIDEQIFLSLPSLKEIYEYLKNVIKLMLKLNIPITWFTPSGLKITQFYNISKQNKVSIKFSGSSKTVVLREKVEIIDKSKQIQAIIPNVIHSLDASHLINLINSAINEKLYPVITVHDCFGTHPNKINQLTFLVKKEFVLLYTNPGYLTLFENRLIQSLKDNNYQIYTDKGGKMFVKPHRTKYYIPIAPKLGKLEICKIFDSKYIIT